MPQVGQSRARRSPSGGRGAHTTSAPPGPAVLRPQPEPDPPGAGENAGPGPTQSPQFSGLGRGPRMCISTKFQGR